MQARLQENARTPYWIESLHKNTSSHSIPSDTTVEVFPGAARSSKSLQRGGLLPVLLPDVLTVEPRSKASFERNRLEVTNVANSTAGGSLSDNLEEFTVAGLSVGFAAFASTHLQS